MVGKMKKTLTVFIITLFLIPCISLAQTTDTNCEFECKNEYQSAKFECSTNTSGPDQDSDNEYCMNDAENSYQRCMNMCISE